MEDMEGACFPLLDLEDKALHLVLSMAAQPQQQQNLYGIFPLICKRFHQLSHSCIRPSSIAVKAPPADEVDNFARWCSKHGGGIQHAVLPATQAVLEHPAIIPSLSNLSSLELVPGGENVNAAAPPSSFSSLSTLTSLTSLKINQLKNPPKAEQLLPLLQQLTDLQELQLLNRLNGGSWWTPDLLVQLTSSLTNLSTLCLSVDMQHNLSTSASVQGLQRLKQLGLHQSCIPSIEALQQVGKFAITSLSELKIQLFPEDDEILVHDVVSWLNNEPSSKQLKSLGIRDCTALWTDDGVLSLLLPELAKLPQLRELQLYCRGLLDSLEYLPLPESLESLSLSFGNGSVGAVHEKEEEEEEKQTVWFKPDELYSSLSRLTSLTLTGVTEGAEVKPHLLGTLGRLSNLRSLTLTCIGVQAADWFSLSSLVQLTYLELHTISGDSPGAALVAIVSLEPPPCITGSLVRMVSNMKSLQTLRLYDMLRGGSNAPLHLDAFAVAAAINTLPALANITVQLQAVAEVQSPNHGSGWRSHSGGHNVYQVSYIFTFGQNEPAGRQLFPRMCNAGVSAF